MNYKYKKQTEIAWVDDKEISTHKKFLPEYQKLLDRSTFSIAKVAIDLEKRNQALIDQIEKMIKEVKGKMVKDFPGGPPAIRTFTNFDKSVKVEAVQGSGYDFDEKSFEAAKESFREYLKSDTGEENKTIKDALSKVFGEDQKSKRDIDLISDFSKKFIDSLKDNEHFQAGIKAMKGIYQSKERTYYKVSVMTEAGQYKKVSLNINELA